MSLPRTVIRRRVVLCMACLAIVAALFLYFNLFRSCLTDDAFITLQYARNLLQHRTWGFLPGATSNTATSALNVILTAGAGLALPGMITAAVALATLEAAVLLLVLLHISQRVFKTWYFGILAFMAMIGSPILVSAMGLETLLYSTLMAAAVLLIIERRWVLLAITLALLTMTRPDGLLLWVAALPAVGAGQRSPLQQSDKRRGDTSRIRPLLHYVAAYGVVLAPWLLFSWIHLGSFLPDTSIIKARAGMDTLTQFRFIGEVGRLCRTYPVQAFFGFAWLPIGLVAFPLKTHPARRAAGVLLRFVLMYAALYSFVCSFPQPWYYSPMVTACTLVACMRIAALKPTCVRRCAGLRLAVLPALCIMGTMGFLAWHRFQPDEAPIHANWGTQADYREIGLWVTDHTQPGDNIRFSGEVGTIAYYSQRRVLDEFGYRRDLQAILNALDRDGRTLPAFLRRIDRLWFEAEPEPLAFKYCLVTFTPDEARRLPPSDTAHRWTISSRWDPEGHVVVFADAPYFLRLMP